MSIKLAINFDSVNTSIFLNGSGVVLCEPTVCAVEKSQELKVKAVGNDAKKLIGKTTADTKIVFPVFEGEIVNEKIAVEVLKYFLNKIEVLDKLAGSVCVFSVPCGLSDEILDKYRLVAKKIGLRKVYFAEAPVLSAIGYRISLNESSPCFVIDMEGSTTSIAGVSLEGVIAGLSVNFGGNKVTTDIIDFISSTYGLQIGLLTAEKIKKEIGSLDDNDCLSILVNGRDIKEGTPRSMIIKALDIYSSIKKYYDKVGEIAIMVLKKLSPEVSAEIRHSGIYLSGEDCQIFGLKNYFEKIFDIQVNIAENSEFCSTIGGGIAVCNLALLKKIAIK